jgi:arylsulfatase A-like enzyme
MAKLQEWGIADDTMLIITSDHGDELFEDGRVGHGAALRESLVWVPLVIHYPKLFPAKSIPEGADVVDIVPTLADVFGAEMNDDWQGESLLPLAQGVGAGYPRMSFASKYEDAHVARIGSWKIRVGGAGAPRLYDLAADPGEKSNVAGKYPVAERLLADAYWQMRAYNKEWRKWKWGNAANVRPAYAESFGE